MRKQFGYECLAITVCEIVLVKIFSDKRFVVAKQIDKSMNVHIVDFHADHLAVAIRDKLAIDKVISELSVCRYSINAHTSFAIKSVGEIQDIL